MSYAAFDPTVREIEANEYLNIRTGQPEVVRYYGAYRVKETFLTPDREILLLAHDPHGVQKFATGVHNQSLGRYFDNGLDARRDFAQRIAESFGLVVGPSGSKVVREGHREALTQDVQAIKGALADWRAAREDWDVNEEAGDALEKEAGALAKRLQRLGVLSRRVYADYDVSISV